MWSSDVRNGGQEWAQPYWSSVGLYYFLVGQSKLLKVQKTFIVVVNKRDRHSGNASNFNITELFWNWQISV